MRNRSLSDREKAILLEAAKPFTAGHKIDISTVGSDPEPERYAQQFAAVLKEAGWTVTRGYGAAFGLVDYGLRVATGKEPSWVSNPL